ncbi:polyadenylate-binding protein 7, partial [Tanacetum coccineum]
CLDIVVACDMGCLDIVATCSTGRSIAAKIPGMPLRMDNMKLILLLESPASFVAELEEDVHVLKLFNRTTKVEYYRMLQNCCIGLSSTTTHFVETIC